MLQCNIGSEVLYSGLGAARVQNMCARQRDFLLLNAYYTAPESSKVLILPPDQSYNLGIPSLESKGIKAGIGLALLIHVTFLHSLAM